MFKTLLRIAGSVTSQKAEKPANGQPDVKNPDEMSFLEHLEALRWHIIRAIAAIVVVGIGVFVAKDFVFDKIILGPTNQDFATYRWFCSLGEKLCFYPKGLEIITRDISEQFLVHIRVSVWLGLIVAFPYVFWEFWRFVKPGLYDKERNAARGVVFICSALFIVGVLFGYYIISPFAITFLSSYSVSEKIANTTTLSTLVNSMTMFTIPTGLVFELPIVIYFLAKIGLVSADFLKTYRRHAIVVILIVAAIITPPDVITQLLVTIPLYSLYEVGIVIAKRVERNQKLAEENA
jgi:sec-independent protein translocase protein TatC